MLELSFRPLIRALPYNTLISELVSIGLFRVKVSRWDGTVELIPVGPIVPGDSAYSSSNQHLGRAGGSMFQWELSL